MLFIVCVHVVRRCSIRVLSIEQVRMCVLVRMCVCIYCGCRSEIVTTLDDSQMAALKQALTKQLAIIQGPPGKRV